jgi:hypothetical protein
MAVTERVLELLAYIEAINNGEVELMQGFDATTPIVDEDASQLFYVAVALAAELGDEGTYRVREELTEPFMRSPN